MPVDLHFAHASDTLLFAAVVAYSLAMLAFAADLAMQRRVPSKPRLAVPAAVDEIAPALVGAGARAVSVPPLGTEPPAPIGPPGQAGSAGPSPAYVGALAVALSVIGWALHLCSVVTRGLAAHRVPWGNMYEFSSMVALIVVTGFLVLLLRRGVRWLGVFVMLPVVLYLGLAGTILYVPAGPLVPALQSYWIKIHVVAAITASGAFMLSGIVTVLYLMRTRFDAVTDAGGRPGFTLISGKLPPAAKLDRTSYAIVAFAFPVWTFAIIAGAIWAESAWGRYWGWDPKETMSFVTWVIYAGYLHARATAGWAGRRAAAISLLGFTALIVNFYVINYVASGLHEYAH